MYFRASLFLFLPVSLLQLIISFFINESPRAIIDNDLEKAEKLLNKIISINGLKEEKVLGKIDDYFVLKHINI